MKLDLIMIKKDILTSLIDFTFDLIESQKLEIENLKMSINIMNENAKHLIKPKTKSAEKYKTPDERYDLPIGTKFIYKGRRFQIIESKPFNMYTCENCSFQIKCPEIFCCLPCYREDNRSIKIIQIKK